MGGVRPWKVQVRNAKRLSEGVCVLSQGWVCRLQDAAEVGITQAGSPVLGLDQ